MTVCGPRPTAELSLVSDRRESPSRSSSGHLEAGYGSGGGHVERADGAVLGDRSQCVASLAGQSGQTVPFRADHQGNRLIAHGQVVNGVAGLADQTDRPDPQGGEALEGGRYPGNQGHGQELDGAGRHLGHRGREENRPVAGQDHPCHAGTLGAPKHRPQVVGIGDPVHHQEERHLAPAVRPTQRLERHAFDRPGQGHHTLGALGPGLHVDPAFRHPFDPHPSGRGQLLDLVQDGGRIHPFGHEHRSHRPKVGGQQFPDGLTALDLVAPQPGRTGSLTVCRRATRRHRPVAGSFPIG